jgi:3-hydroxymyristoyl/3-hydroxydecanoyl-(acyl carrier protein) dehydratase
MITSDMTSIIPQRKPFVMVDSLIEASESGFETTFSVSEDNLFIEDDFLQEPALIENVAQTAAAGLGYLNSKLDAEPKLGFIGAVSKLKVHSLPKINSIINTTVTVLFRMENIFLVKGVNKVDDIVLLECEMKIVIT